VNANSSTLLTMIAMAGLLFGNWAKAGGLDTDECRGGYNLLLVTEGECKAYLDQRHLLEQRKDVEALKNLEADYAILLKERSEVCPCIARNLQSAGSRRPVAYLP
jgi:hypothetical protein